GARQDRGKRRGAEEGNVSGVVWRGEGARDCGRAGGEGRAGTRLLRQARRAAARARGIFGGAAIVGSAPHASFGIAKSTGKPGKTQLDVLIVERGLAASRERAHALLLAGQVRVNGAAMTKPGSHVASDATIEITGEGLRYASRGGMKLEGALEDF